MIALFFAVSAALLLLAFFQVGSATAYVRRLARYVRAARLDDYFPQTLIILSLRGGDDALLGCLQGLANQDYPNYQLRIVVDHPTDPAYELVSRWLETKPPVVVGVEFLREPSLRHTLKFSAIRQVLRNLETSVRAVVLVDGDVNPYPGWLRDMIAPLGLPSVGAVTGSRWYFPSHGSPGAWCRHIFISFALLLTDFFEMPWGGSLAMRREVALHESVLTSEITPNEEPAARHALADLQLKLHFNPRAILWNRGSISLANCTEFIFRQLFWTRLSDPPWIIMFAHALGSCLLLIAAFLYGVVNLWSGAHLASATTALGAIGMYLAAVLFVLAYVHRAMRLHVLPCQGNGVIGKITCVQWWQIVCAAPLTLGVYTFAICWAQLARRVIWRGIKYRIQPTGGVQVVEYFPIAGRSSMNK